MSYSNDSKNLANLSSSVVDFHQAVTDVSPISYAPAELHLKCYSIEGKPQKIFIINVPANATTFTLTTKIADHLRENSKPGDEVDPTDIFIWHRLIPENEEDIIAAARRHDYEDKALSKLAPRKVLSDVIPNPLSEDHVHVLVFRNFDYLRYALKLVERRMITLSSNSSMELVFRKPPPMASNGYPCQTSFTHLETNEVTDFVYRKKLYEDDNKLHYIGRAKGEWLDIKFTRRYRKEVHLWLAERNLAPKLFGVEEIDGGWIMVLMEDFPDWSTLADVENPVSDALKASIKSALEDFHRNGMIHGDILPRNILVNETGTEFRFIDLDWAGYYNHEDPSENATYPKLINCDPTLRRPEDVGPKEYILPSHDMQMYDVLFD